MPLLSKKSTFVIGSIIGSVAGLLFASENGKVLRAKLKSARTPQKKFEAIFQEYLRAGKSVLRQVEGSETWHDIEKGGQEILSELKIRAKQESTAAVKLAQKKTVELIQEAKRQKKNLSSQKTVRRAKKVVRKQVKVAKRHVVKKTKQVKKTVRKTVKHARRTVRKAAKKVRR